MHLFLEGLSLGACLICQDAVLIPDRVIGFIPTKAATPGGGSLSLSGSCGRRSVPGSLSRGIAVGADTDNPAIRVAFGETGALIVTLTQLARRHPDRLCCFITGSTDGSRFPGFRGRSHLRQRP
jgi:hypothetical protein